MTSAEVAAWLGLPVDVATLWETPEADAIWQRALAEIRSHGGDPEAMLAQAGANLSDRRAAVANVYGCPPEFLTPEFQRDMMTEIDVDAGDVAEWIERGGRFPEPKA